MGHVPEYRVVAPRRRAGHEPAETLQAQLIALRLKRGLTQTQLARRVGTRQSAISRLEAPGYTPSFAMLEKVAAALGARIEVRLRTLDE